MFQSIKSFFVYFFRVLSSFHLFARAAFPFPVWFPEYLRITWKYGLYYYNIVLFMPFFHFSTLKNKKVLEIGGSDLPEELLFKKFKAERWTCVDYLGWWEDNPTFGNSETKGKLYHLSQATPELVSAKHIIFDGVVANIPDCFMEQYDTVVSICAMEHIHDLPNALKIIYNTLKPGGEFYACFAPIYSGDKGNHIFLVDSPQSKKVVFNNIPRNGIPRWAHFLIPENELRERLLKRYPEDWVNTICEQCYHSDFINRKFYEEYVQDLNNSPFEEINILNWLPSYITPQIEKRLREICSPYRSFDWNGLIIFAKKSPKVE